jgi:ABC-type microcin C transport system permease subunit YejB
MRIIGMILALGAISWVLYQAAGGGEAETAIPAEYQKSLDQAKDVEQALKDASQKSMQEAEEKLP